MTSVLSLPYDVLREILTGLSAVDVLSFLRVSRRLYYPLIDDDSTWHSFCARYGVTDPSAFGRRSFRTIYGRLLHRYGALLGPWCSDYPCRGNIVEFRLVPDNWLRGGEWIMIGEVWEFKRKAHSQPEHPCYTEFVQIGFTPSKRATRQTANDVHISWHLRSERDLGFLVHNGIPPPWVRMDGNGRLATPSLHVIAPSDQKVATDVDHILNINEMFPTVPWYDAVRGVPRLPQEGPPPLKKESSSRWYDSWSDHAVHYVPGVAKPAAIAFFPPPAGKECDVRVNGLHNPPHYFSIYFEHAVSRYYPLRHPERIGDDPASSEWRAETLEGLWLGDYGVHGTECLFLEYDAVESVVRAWKITGDAHVPRGVCSWEIELKRPTSDFGPSRRSYEGQGTLAPRGFVTSQKWPISATIVGADEITISWDLTYNHKFVRYRQKRGRIGFA